MLNHYTDLCKILLVKVVSLRNHPKDLPTAEEIKSMMALEAKRKPSSSQHFPDFSTVDEWMKVIGVKTHLFESTRSLDEVTDEATNIKSAVVERTLEILPERQLEAVERYLGEEDLLQKADLAIVFGGKTLARAEKAAQLYLAGWVPRLVMTGKGPVYKGEFDLPEAEVFKNKAVELGVPEEAIIIEPESINIASNVRATLNLLDKLSIGYQTIAQVMSWYAQRRAWVTLKKYASVGVELVRVNADLPLIDGRVNDYDKGEWFKTSEGVEIVFNEFVKMRHQVVTDTA